MNALFGRKNFQYFVFFMLVHNLTFAIPNPEDKQHKVIHVGPTSQLSLPSFLNIYFSDCQQFERQRTLPK